jgi:hypothetical protein
MFLKTLSCGAVLACGVLSFAGLHLPGNGCPGARCMALTSLSAAAGEQKDKGKPALSGTWVVQGGQLKIEYSDKDVMKIFPHGDNMVIVIVCQYTVDKKGLVKAKITELQGEAKQKVEKIVPVGLEFNFTWTVKDDTAALNEVKGEKVDVLKSHLEGKYDQKK